MSAESPAGATHFDAAVVRLVAAVMASGVGLALYGRDELERMLTAAPTKSLGEALMPRAEEFVMIRRSLIEAVREAAGGAVS